MLDPQQTTRQAFSDGDEIHDSRVANYKPGSDPIYSSGFRLLRPDEELSLLKRALKGDEEARDRLIVCNYKLVIRVANRCKSTKLPISDLVQEELIGLIHAIDMYDPEKGTRLSTYAIH